MTYSAITLSLANLTLLAIGLALLVFLALLVPAARERLTEQLAGGERLLLGTGAFVAGAAMVGSLWFSEVVGFVPCLLCWYQRIAMYPLVLLLGLAAWRGDALIWRYTLPLSVVGLGIAIYHVTIQYRPALAVAACTEGVPCTGRYVHVHGLVSIPFMAGGAFLLITALLLLVRLAAGRSEEA